MFPQADADEGLANGQNPAFLKRARRLGFFACASRNARMRSPTSTLRPFRSPTSCRSLSRVTQCHSRPDASSRRASRHAATRRPRALSTYSDDDRERRPARARDACASSLRAHGRPPAAVPQALPLAHAARQRCEVSALRCAVTTAGGTASSTRRPRRSHHERRARAVPAGCVRRAQRSNDRSLGGRERR